MRHRFIPACVCLMTWTSSTGPDPTLPPATFTSIATNRVLSEPSRVVGGLSENIDVDRVLGDTYAAIALPLAPLGLLLKPIIYRSQEEICDALTEAARSNDLPAPFFIRLLFQESGFRPGVISSAGALGIAQFMPETAADRGPDNPFDPLQAIPESARLLRDLSRRFGNLGLAAAAYNAGPKRVEDWLTKKGKLPQETQHYVKDDHRLASGHLDYRPDRQPTGEAATSGTLPGGRRSACLGRTGPNPSAADESASEGFSELCRNCAPAGRSGQPQR
jgi:hypothetical protein